MQHHSLAQGCGLHQQAQWFWAASCAAQQHSLGQGEGLDRLSGHIPQTGRASMLLPACQRPAQQLGFAEGPGPQARPLSEQDGRPSQLLAPPEELTTRQSPSFQAAAAVASKQSRHLLQAQATSLRKAQGKLQALSSLRPPLTHGAAQWRTGCVQKSGVAARGCPRTT